MLIYILHSDRFYSFRLPKIVSGNYVLFDYDNKGFKRSLVNIYSENGKWRIKSNNDIQIVSNNQNLESVELNEYNFYQLSVYKTESVLLYVSPACETNYVTKEVVDNSSIVFGSGSDCDVILTIPSISGRQIELTYNNGVWSFKNLATVVPIYINKIKKLEGKISNLDSIFVMGLKIVVCGKNLFISVPFGNINFMGNKLVDSTGILSVQNRVDNNEIYKDFYESSEYFSKSPIFRKNKYFRFNYN